MAIENSITFGGVNSADFGIYISGEGVFNAPQRDVEMIEIPGRNGEFALDNGRFKNIEVSYPAFNFEPDDYDSFVQNLSDFRNAICSLRGYQRLTDTFHPDEYREAVYIGGLEIKPVKYNTASEFTIVFDCKPQRWLTSGETKQTIANSGDTLTNPTLFESSPLLEIDGYGTIQFNGYEVEIADTEYGKQILKDSYLERLISTSEIVIPDWLYKANDVITLSGAKELAVLGCFTDQTYHYIYYDTDVPTFTVSSDVTYDWYVGITTPRSKSGNCSFDISYPDISFPMGVAFSKELNASFSGLQRDSQDATVTRACEVHLGIIVTYDGNKTIQIYIGWASVSPHTQYVSIVQGGTYYSEFIQPEVSVLSTKRIVEQKIYLDCDLGEAYSVEDGVITSLNQYIDLGSDLPTLAPGTNTVTYDNTITELNIVPRWWKV